MATSRLPQRFAYTLVGLLMAGIGFVVHHRHHGYEPTFEAGHMPACDSGVVRRLLWKAIDEAPDAKSQHIKVLKLGSFADTTKAMEADEGRTRPDRRQCVGEVFWNGGHDLVLFTVDWTNGDKNEVYLEIPELPF